MDDSLEADEFFAQGDAGLYEGGPASLRVVNDVPEVEIAPIDPDVLAARDERRERFVRAVTRLVSALALFCAGLGLHHMVAAESAEAREDAAEAAPIAAPAAPETPHLSKSPVSAAPDTEAIAHIETAPQAPAPASGVAGSDEPLAEMESGRAPAVAAVPAKRPAVTEPRRTPTRSTKPRNLPSKRRHASTAARRSGTAASLGVSRSAGSMLDVDTTSRRTASKAYKPPTARFAD